MYQLFYIPEIYLHGPECAAWNWEMLWWWRSQQSIETYLVQLPSRDRYSQPLFGRTPDQIRRTREPGLVALRGPGLRALNDHVAGGSWGPDFQADDAPTGPGRQGANVADLKPRRGAAGEWSLRPAISGHMLGAIHPTPAETVPVVALYGWLAHHADPATWLVPAHAVTEFQAQVTPPIAAQVPRALQRLLDAALLEQVGDALRLRSSDDPPPEENAWDRLLLAYPAQADALRDLSNRFGWTMDDRVPFAKKVCPLLEGGIDPTQAVQRLYGMAPRFNPAYRRSVWRSALVQAVRNGPRRVPTVIGSHAFTITVPKTVTRRWFSTWTPREILAKNDRPLALKVTVNDRRAGPVITVPIRAGVTRTLLSKHAWSGRNLDAVVPDADLRVLMQELADVGLAEAGGLNLDIWVRVSARVTVTLSYQ